LKENNRHKASIILAAVTAGFLLSYPFAGTFPGRLLTALFGASMIGGLADWFGITALFRKPLGIPFRTEIIPKSREKIFDSLAGMVENELLTRESLIAKLEKFDISGKLLLYLDEDGGRKDLADLAARIASELLGRIDPDRAGTYLERLLNENSDNIRFSELFSDSVLWLSENITDQRLVAAVVEEIKDFILFPEFGLLVNGIIRDIFDGIQRSADMETAGRKLFFRFVLAVADFSDMSPSKLSARILTEALEYFNALKSPDSIQRKGLEAWLAKTADELRSDQALHEKIERKGLDMLKKAGTGPAFANHVYPRLKDEKQFRRLQSFAAAIVDRLVEGFRKSPEEQAALDAFVKKALTRMVEENHQVIGRMVRQKLETFSNETLVELVEEKAGNDLQIIRINGSIVGGLVGLAAFLLTFWI
jgi:uncharacterized membrane-anchored protein YjiN (DUF445 family)